MNNSEYKTAILKMDLRTTATTYSDDEIYESLKYAPTLENGGLKKAPSGIRSNSEHSLTHDMFVFTKEGEFLSFKKFDILKKLLARTQLRLREDDALMPSEDDKSLYNSTKNQLEFICKHNTRLMGVAIKSFFKNRPTDTNRPIFESDANYAVFIAVNRFDHTRGYKFSTYYVTVARNLFKSSSNQIRRISNVIPAGIKPFKLNNRRLQAGHGVPHRGIDDLVSTEDNPREALLNKSLYEGIQHYLIYLNPIERMLIEEYYFNNQDLRSSHRKNRKKLNMSPERYRVHFRSGLKKLKRFIKLQDFIWR